MNKLLICLTLGILLVGAFSLVGLDNKEEINFELNDCNPIVYKMDSINSALERYERIDCFQGYNLFLEVNE
jgi:hypothetical protein